ncbi:MAG: hypothetical protein DME33_10205 [Verrucomicrobia bacterium]|nr:MAG: hypothetical protein DME33_10205 [Verrucomicrobiota bacterium]
MRHEFETRSFPESLAACPRGFAFYLANPHRLGSRIRTKGRHEFHEFSRMFSVAAATFGVRRLDAAFPLRSAACCVPSALL